MEEKKTPKKKLSKSDKKFVVKFVETGNATKAVQESYGIKDSNVAANKGSRLLRKANIEGEIEVERISLKQALINEGITPNYIASKVNTLLKNKDPNAIDKGLKHTMNVYGITDTDDKPKISNTYNFIFNADTQKEIKEMEDKIKNRLIQNHGEKSN